MTKREFVEQNIAQVFHSCLIGSGEKTDEASLPGYALDMTLKLWDELEKKVPRDRGDAT